MAGFAALIPKRAPKAGLAAASSKATPRRGQCSSAGAGERLSPRTLPASNGLGVPSAQAKLELGSTHDPLEAEADRVADQVVGAAAHSAPQILSIGAATTPTAQRACAGCGGRDCKGRDGTGCADAKTRTGATPAEVPSSISGRVEQASRGGQPLPRSSRAFLEPHFGLDLAKVSVHTNEESANVAEELGARAFTIGGHIFFGRGRYDPDSGVGLRLLAHELTHVVQQSGGARATGARSADAAPVQPGAAASGVVRRTPEPDAPSRPAPDRVCDSRESNPVVWFQFDSTLLRSDATIDSTIHLASLIARVQQHFALAGSLGQVQLDGYASAEGGAAHNLDLSRRRAEAVKARLETAGIPSAQISATGFGENSDLPGREFNRRVEICLTPPVEEIEMDSEEITVERIDCAAPPAAVTSFEQYAQLVRCVEVALPHLGPRDMLDLLRRAYYNGGHWPEVIPCGTADGAAGLGSLGRSHPRLQATLVASKVVGGVDVGHVFTALEAMVCPSTSVEIEVFGPNPVVAMPNEEFASFGGDLGSAVAARTRDETDRSLIRPWTHYFGTVGSWASYEDLRGDIDGFVIRAALAGRCAGTRGTRLPALTAPMSEILLAYYAGGSIGTPGLSVADRFRCFVEALGGIISGRSITNKAALTSAMSPRVRSFAQVFYLSLVTVPLFAIGPAQAIFLSVYSQEFSERFVDWLETQL